ncbi:hypothetical protein SUGI_0369690 [Cryptomeria japonica]|nr:hypothetical protein SUGI_0369690 [Cryptomeria japonica]
MAKLSTGEIREHKMGLNKVRIAVLFGLMLLMGSVGVMADPTCDPDKNIWCDKGRCCSVNNWCGTGPNYCGYYTCLA